MTSAWINYVKECREKPENKNKSYREMLKICSAEWRKQNPEKKFKDVSEEEKQKKKMKMKAKKAEKKVKFLNGKLNELTEEKK